MAIQTTYGTNIGPAFEGMIADSRDQEVESRSVETAAGIGFGKVVVKGTTDDQVRVSEAARAFVGITVAEHGQAADLYPQYSTCSVLRRGAIWVQASVAVATEDPVYFVPATGVLTNVATSNTALPDATWRTSTTGAGLAVVRFG